VTFYGLVMAGVSALYFFLRTGRGWTKRWRLWLLGAPPGSKPPQKHEIIT